MALLPGARRADRRASTMPRGNATANWDRLMEVRDDVLKSLETARNEKLIGAPLEARVRLSANGDLLPAARTVRGASCPACSSCRRWTLERRQAASLASRWSAPPAIKCERCWKYTTDVGAEPEFPDHLRARAPRRSTRCREWLICAVKAYGIGGRGVRARPPDANGSSRAACRSSTPHKVIPGFFDIVHSENRGVAFGIFNDSTSEWRTTLLVVAVAGGGRDGQRHAVERRSAWTAARSGACR